MAHGRFHIKKLGYYPQKRLHYQGVSPKIGKYPLLANPTITMMSHLTHNSAPTPDRAYFRRARRALTPKQRAHAAHRASLHLMRLLPLLPRGAKVALYQDSFGELPTTPLLRLCQRYGLHAYLPVVHGKALKFAPIYPKHTLTLDCRDGFFGMAGAPHRLGMIEPISRPQLPAQMMDVIFCPLVAVDVTGARLGMGGGYYDRTLAHTQALKVGWCYDFQLAERLPRQPWDIAMDVVICPSRLLWCT